MTYLQFFASIVGSLAWPIAAVALAVFLRRPVISLLNRTESAEGFGAKVTFAQRVEAVAESVRLAAEAQPADEQTQGPALITDQTGRAISELTDELSDATAVGTIISAWAELEQGLRQIAESNHFEWSDKSMVQNIRHFDELNLMNSSERAAIDSLRMLRNEVVHARRAPPSLSDAAAYRTTVRNLLKSIGLNAGLHSWR